MGHVHPSEMLPLFVVRCDSPCPLGIPAVAVHCWEGLEVQDKAWESLGSVDRHTGRLHQLQSSGSFLLLFVFSFFSFLFSISRSPHWNLDTSLDLQARRNLWRCSFHGHCYCNILLCIILQIILLALSMENNINLIHMGRESCLREEEELAILKASRDDLFWDRRRFQFYRVSISMLLLLVLVFNLTSSFSFLLTI